MKNRYQTEVTREIFRSEQICRVVDIAYLLGGRITHAEFKFKDGIPVPQRFTVEANLDSNFHYSNYDCDDHEAPEASHSASVSPDSVSETLSQLSEPARAYYHRFAPFTRGYGFCCNNKVDYERLKTDIDAIIELANVGLVSQIEVFTFSPYDGDDYAKTQSCMVGEAVCPSGCPRRKDK